jgi:hypothetical protein
MKKYVVALLTFSMACQAMNYSPQKDEVVVPIGVPALSVSDEAPVSIATRLRRRCERSRPASERRNSACCSNPDCCNNVALGVTVTLGMGGMAGAILTAMYCCSYTS